MSNENSVIEDSEKYFPNRTLTIKEKKLILAQLLRFSTVELSETLPVDDRLNSKLVDSNIINRFIKNCPNGYVEQIWLQLSCDLRILLTKNKITLGLENEVVINDIVLPLVQ